MMPYAPLGTLYAAAYLRKHGFTSILFDSMLAEREQYIIPYIKMHKPKIVVIYDDDFNYLSKMCLSRMRKAAFTMSRFAKGQECTVVVHGSDAADHIKEYIDHGADYVIVGEGELTLSELIQHLSGVSKNGLEHISGLAYRNNGSIIENPRRDVVHDLDTFDFPARDLVDTEKYRQLWKHRHGYFSMNIVTTRGCPFHCNWCAKPIYGQVYHSRSPENVIEEMKMLKTNYRPDHLWFCDDIFGLKPGWITKFADLVTQHKAQIPFKCLSRADLLLKENAIDHLASSGCQTVWIGAESGSQKILDAMEKGITIEQIYKSTQLLHQHGIHVGFFLQYGYPGESREDIELTLKMVKDCKPDEIGVSVSYPLPGTKFYEHVKQQLGEKQNWVESQDLDLMFSGPYVPDFYRTLHKITHKKFRIWQGFDILKSVISHPSSLNRYALRRLAATAYHLITLPQLKTQLNALASKPNPKHRA